jgi:hypothetical protein
MKADTPLTERVEVRLTKPEREKLDRIARSEDRTVSAVVRRWIRAAQEPTK